MNVFVMNVRAVAVIARRMFGVLMRMRDAAERGRGYVVPTAPDGAVYCLHEQRGRKQSDQQQSRGGLGEGHESHRRSSCQGRYTPKESGSSWSLKPSGRRVNIE